MLHVVILAIVIALPSITGKEVLFVGNLGSCINLDEKNGLEWSDSDICNLRIDWHSTEVLSKPSKQKAILNPNVDTFLRQNFSIVKKISKPVEKAKNTSSSSENNKYKEKNTAVNISINLSLLYFAAISIPTIFLAIVILLLFRENQINSLETSDNVRVSSEALEDKSLNKLNNTQFKQVTNMSDNSNPQLVYQYIQQILNIYNKDKLSQELSTLDLNDSLKDIISDLLPKVVEQELKALASDLLPKVVEQELKALASDLLPKVVEQELKALVTEDAKKSDEPKTEEIHTEQPQASDKVEPWYANQGTPANLESRTQHTDKLTNPYKITDQESRRLLHESDTLVKLFNEHPTNFQKQYASYCQLVKETKDSFSEGYKEGSQSVCLETSSTGSFMAISFNVVGVNTKWLIPKPNEKPDEYSARLWTLLFGYDGRPCSSYKLIKPAKLRCLKDRADKFILENPGVIEFIS